MRMAQRIDHIQLDNFHRFKVALDYFFIYLLVSIIRYKIYFLWIPDLFNKLNPLLQVFHSVNN